MVLIPLHPKHTLSNLRNKTIVEDIYLRPTPNPQPVDLDHNRKNTPIYITYSKRQSLNFPVLDAQSNASPL